MQGLFEFDNKVYKTGVDRFEPRVKK